MKSLVDRSSAPVPGAAHAGKAGAFDRDVVLEIGGQRVRVGPADASAPVDPPQQTESLARELVRGLLGGEAAPTIELVRGPGAPSQRDLPAPGAAPIVIGRGDEATWVILDEDLSREHAELSRDWTGVIVRDLGSKNGTRVNGEVITEPTRLVDGAVIELGTIALEFHDPAERHLYGTAPRKIVHTARVDPLPAPPPRSLRGPIAGVVAAVALAGWIWVVAS